MKTSKLPCGCIVENSERERFVSECAAHQAQTAGYRAAARANGGMFKDADRRDRIAADAARYPADPPGYAERVRELEAEGLTTSDAQGVADAELMRGAGLIPDAAQVAP